MASRERIGRDLRMQLQIALEQGDFERAQRLTGFIQELEGGALAMQPDAGNGMGRGASGGYAPHNGAASLRNEPRALADRAVTTASAPMSTAGSAAEDPAMRVIDSTLQAVHHYFTGKGETVELGPKTRELLMTHPEQLRRSERIRTGKTTRLSGNYGVDMQDDMFHLGETPVDYDIVCDGRNCTVTYRAFVRDGFWDPFVNADGIGPRAEIPGGTTYRYKPFVWTENFTR